MRYRDQFKKKYTLLPVIHVRDEEQAIQNASLALEHGDGCFLINHSISPKDLLHIYETVRKKFPSAWIGVNCLGWTPGQMFLNVPRSVDGLWADNASIKEDSRDQPRARQYLEARKQSQWDGLYFGGVAFKYQRPVHDYAKVSKKAAPFMDVVCTSGPGTGKAKKKKKIEAMKQALLKIDGTPLAIASGSAFASPS